MNASLKRDFGRNLAGRQPDSGQPESCEFDLVHLSRQTLGDRALEVELLRLFERQCAQIVARLEKLDKQNGDLGQRRDLAHTLKGSARSVGAGRVAAAAELYESDLASAFADSSPSLARLAERCAAARLEAARLSAEA